METKLATYLPLDGNTEERDWISANNIGQQQQNKNLNHTNHTKQEQQQGIDDNLQQDNRSLMTTQQLLEVSFQHTHPDLRQLENPFFHFSVH